MGGRNENSPSTQRRPLSIIQENSDEEGGPNDVTTTHEGPHKRKFSGEHGKTITETNNNVVNGQTNAVRKTRKKAVAPQQHPIFSFALQNGNIVHHLHDQSDSNSTESRLHSEHETEGDLSRLKDTATKLNLKTRRQSYLTWRAKYLDKPRDPPEVKIASSDGKLTPERKERMDNAIQWIQRELIDMKRQDQSLARQLLGIRSELSRLRLRASCEEHQELLEDAKEDLEELRELSRFADFPLDSVGANPLRQIGVTKMNLTSRRFSTC